MKKLMMLRFLVRVLPKLAYLGFWLTIGIPLAPIWHDRPSQVEPAGDREELAERPMDVVIQWCGIAWWMTIPPLVMWWAPVPLLTQGGAALAALLVGRRIAAMRGLGPGVRGWACFLWRHRLPVGISLGVLIVIAIEQDVLWDRSGVGGDVGIIQGLTLVTWAWALVAGLTLGIAAIRILGPEQTRWLTLRAQIAGVIGVKPEVLRPEARGDAMTVVIPGQAATRTTEQIVTHARAALPRWEVQRQISDADQQVLLLTPVSEDVARQRRAGDASGGLLGDEGATDQNEAPPDVWAGWRDAA
ncbi:MAG: hypothetical protein L0H74_01720 [Brachybacterium sp.]|nr:hypothetical protein [Brachybacterium sp.]